MTGGEADLEAQPAELRAWTRRVEGDVADLAAQLPDADVQKYAPL